LQPSHRSEHLRRPRPSAPRCRPPRRRQRPQPRPRRQDPRHRPRPPLAPSHSRFVPTSPTAAPPARPLRCRKPHASAEAPPNSPKTDPATKNSSSDVARHSQVWTLGHSGRVSPRTRSSRSEFRPRQ
jgi:hypothetical protein